MKKQNGFSQIFVMVIMLILAIALPVTTNLVKKVQDNRSSAAGPSITCNATLAETSHTFNKICGTGDNSRYVYQCKTFVSYNGSKTYNWNIIETCLGTDICSGGKCQKPLTTCVSLYGTGMECVGSSFCPDADEKGHANNCGSGLICCPSSKVVKTSTTTTNSNCTSTKCVCSDNTACSSAGCNWTYSNSGIGQCIVKTSAPASTIAGDELCIAKGGECQTLGGGKMPSVGTNNCTIHGVTGSIQANLCTGQYNSTSRCCVPGSTSAPAASAPAAAVAAVAAPIPTAVPTAIPTAVPTAVPTTVPTAIPTAAPTAVPVAGYTAPKLNMLFAISGVKKIDTCFGDLKFKVSITKNGSSVATTNEVTATVVDNKFNTKFGDQVFKITDFALTNDYALTDKIKITISSSRKILATIYGKDNQASGFPALNNSTILVSDLVGNTLNFYEYPVLNGDIGKEGTLGVADNVVNGFDFAFMKSEWGKTCSTGQNLNADLNGDCRVDTFDLQILKNAMAEQLAQKTD